MISNVSSVGDARTVAARLDRLPITSVHRTAIAILGALLFFDFGDQFVLAYVAPSLVRVWHITLADVASLNAVTFLGMAIGATVGGRIGDHIGRKNAVRTATIWVSVFSLLNAFAPTLSVLLVLRFLTGLGLTAVTAIVNPYIAEIFPADQRGKVEGWIMTCAYIGTVVISLVATLAIPLHPQAWRLTFAYGFLGIGVLYFFRLLPESPRWLALHGHVDQADLILDRLEVTARTEHGALGPVEAVRTAPLLQPAASSFAYGQLVRGVYLQRTLLIAALFSLVTLGVIGFVTWVPVLLVSRGFSLGDTLFYALLISLAAPMGAALSSVLADRVERKRNIWVYCILIAVSGGLYGLSSQPALIVLFGFLSTFLFQGLSPFLFTYASELFPTEVRSSAFGLTYGASRFANVLGPFIINFLFSRFGYVSVFGYITVCWLLSAMLIVAFGLRTNRQSLEHLGLDTTAYG